MNAHNEHITDALLVSYLLEETTPEQIAVVEAWLDESAANKTYLLELKKVWEESFRKAVVSSPDEEAAWQRFKQRITPHKTVVRKIHPGWWQAAAVILLLAGAAYFIFRNDNATPQMLIASSGDAIRTDTLADGSVITLNKQSSLSYPQIFSGNNRKVSLQGEAFFNIAPDRSKPFIISVNDVTVTVLGTSFNIKSTGGATEVIVETGLVEVQRKAQKVALKPGQKLRVAPADSALVVQEEKSMLHRYYQTKEFVCDGTPLWKLAEVLSEAYDVSIIIERPSLRNLLLDVTFSNESLDNILEIIRMTFNTHNIRIIKTGNQIILR